MKNLSLYIHIPFCVRKCLYCDFVSFDGCDLATKEEYVKALCEEIYTRSLNFDVKEYMVDTIFFGGGTPSLIDEAKISAIMEEVKRNFNISSSPEITIEMNPGTVTKEKLKAYKELGINRISIGLQSGNDEELKALGRIHNYKEFIDCYNMARDMGFDNINIDIMSAIPNQTIESYKDTLTKVLKLNPEHISAYSLIIEEGTPFYDMNLNLPSEEDEREMYYLTKNLLAEQGYDRYEISNYSKKGKECKHNIGYWTGKEYLGLGLNAASYYKGARRKNTSDMNKYLSCGFEEEFNICNEQSEMEEYMFLGLRMTQGVSFEKFYKKFARKLLDVYGLVVNKHINEGLIVIEGDYLKLTDRGMDLSNYVLADFLLD